MQGCFHVSDYRNYNNYGERQQSGFAEGEVPLATIDSL